MSKSSRSSLAAPRELPSVKGLLRESPGFAGKQPHPEPSIGSLLLKVTLRVVIAMSISGALGYYFSVNASLPLASIVVLAGAIVSIILALSLSKEIDKANKSGDTKV